MSDSRKYWEKFSEGKELQTLIKPCHDCAMTCGFYADFADELINNQPDLVDAVKKRWFCHNHSDRACKGLDDYIARSAYDSTEQARAEKGEFK